jgi:hypothetical protein
MKSLFKLVGASALLCLCFAIPGSAQILNGLTFTTTFPFYAGNTKLPAGAYTVRPVDFGSDTLVIEDSTGKHSAFIDIEPTQTEPAHKSGDVTFHKYVEIDFLNRLWVGGQQYGMQVEQTKYEKKLAASGVPQTHSVPGTAK